jgi:flagellar basal body-associated protein FliL
VDIKGLIKKIPPIKGLFKKKLIIIIASSLVLISLLIFALFFFLQSDGDESKAENDSGVENMQINNVDYENIVVLKQFKWIALHDRSFMEKLSVNISLELISKDKLDLVETHRKEIRASVRSTAAEMRWMELRSPEGKLNFKYIVIKKINSLFPDIVIRNLYLTHFIMR